MLTACQVTVVAWRTEDGETWCPDCAEDGETHTMHSVIRFSLDEEQAAGADEREWKGLEPVCCDRCGREILEGTEDELPVDLTAWELDNGDIACKACAEDKPWQRDVPFDAEQAQEWVDRQDGLPLVCARCGDLIWPLDDATVEARELGRTPANNARLAAITAPLF